LAAPNFTSAERADVYRSMFLLNLGFHRIVTRLDQIQHLLSTQDLKDMRGLAQEVQLEINTAVLNTLESVENNDHAQFGKVRIALEKRLKTPLPEPRRKK
jgi:hypothetical protein